MLRLLLTFLAKLLGAVAFPFTLVRFRGQKNARPRVHSFTVLLGTAGAAGLGTSTGSVLGLVLLRARTGFVLVRCLCYCNGGPMARPWFKVLWLNWRQDLRHAGWHACNHFGPTANKKVYAQCAIKVRARSIYLHSRCHFQLTRARASVA